MNEKYYNMEKYFYEEKMYFDYEITFNGTAFKVHLKLLSKFFTYFEPLEEQKFKEKKSLVVNHKKLCGNLLDASYFNDMLKFIYLNNDHDMKIFVNDKNIIDLIEYTRLFKYFGFKGEIETIKEKIKQKILDIKPIDVCNKIYQSTIQKCGGGYSSTFSSSWIGCYATSTVNLIPTLDPCKKAMVTLYNKQEKINFMYLIELLNIFEKEDDEFKYKLIGISTLKIKNMIQLPKEYQKIAMMSYCLEEFNDGNEEDNDETDTKSSKKNNKKTKQEEKIQK